MRSTRCWVASTRRQQRPRRSPTRRATADLAPSGRLPGGSGQAGAAFFWCLFRGQVDCAQHRQQRRGPQGQGARPIPAWPPAPLLVLQTPLARGLCQAPCHGPAAARHRYDRCHGGRLGSTHAGGGPCRRGTPPPADQQPAAPGGLPRRGEGEPRPVRPARPWRSGASAHPEPARRGPRGAPRGDLR
jgi:hypothetical protein